MVKYLIFFLSFPVFAELTWTAPTTYIDGSPLTVKEYKVYCGPIDGPMTVVLTTPNTKASPTACTPSAQWAVTASDGTLESNYSNIVKTTSAPTNPVLTCVKTWTVKSNPRRADGARPIKNIETNKYTGKYIPQGSSCGDRASPNYPIYYRVVPGGMAICE